MDNYEEMLQPCTIAEKRQINSYSREENLVNWWLRQSEKMENLRTVDGERLIVLEAGQRNAGPGPDIFRSRILLDDFEIGGSIEMHIKAGDWFAHGHHHDEKYGSVILHVILEGDTGPDISTLRVDRKYLGAGGCLSSRQISKHELLAQAYFRFERKQKHIHSLALGRQGYSPLLLGMIEVIMAGSFRFSWLHQVASMLGLQHWPDCRPWEGSNQGYPSGSSKPLLLNRILESQHLFRPEDWLRSTPESWPDVFAEMQVLGLSSNQCLEWQVNILAPFMGPERGFMLWQTLKIFRHYGLEKKVLPRLGLSKISRVVEQQGVVEWKKNYCSTGSCSNCSLTQHHHTLTHIN